MNSIKALNIIAIFLIISFFTIPVFGQFRLNKLKIKNYKTNQGGQKVKTNPRIANIQMVIDDGYTFFDAEPVEKYDSKLNIDREIGWYLRSKLRVLADLPSKSAINIKVMRNDKDLYNMRCEGKVFKAMTVNNGRDSYSLDLVKIEQNKGNWECKVVHKGRTIRRLLWKAVGTEIVPYGEQKSGKLNLFHDAAIVDMEIPVGGSPIDYRLTPIRNAGLFYGISWTTESGKGMMASVPKVGFLLHIPSSKTNK